MYTYICIIETLVHRTFFVLRYFACYMQLDYFVNYGYCFH